MRSRWIAVSFVVFLCWLGFSAYWAVHAQGTKQDSAPDADAKSRLSAATEAVPKFARGVKCGTLPTDELDEVSGIAASRKNPGVLWVHNDSGDSARVFAITPEGKLLGVYSLSGVEARDWEDIAVGPGPKPGESWLYIGDIGDNNAVRPMVFIYRVAEPTVSTAQEAVRAELADVEKITLKYEDGPRDAEVVMVDPQKGDLYIISKRTDRCKVYRVPSWELKAGATVTMRCVAQLPWGWATGGDISPDGSEILVRGYTNAGLWKRPQSGELWNAFEGKQYIVPLEKEQQGEAICFDAQGKGYYTTSEGKRSPIYYYDRLSDR
ncbi:MAG: hypothetical protein QHI38_05810 [Armatimonadota bacterium]|nr:hypothetical protein [Armatimonadota bacterium]